METEFPPIIFHPQGLELEVRPLDMLLAMTREAPVIFRGTP